MMTRRACPAARSSGGLLAATAVSIAGLTAPAPASRPRSGRAPTTLTIAGDVGTPLTLTPPS